MLRAKLYPYQVPAVDALIHRGSLLLAFGPGLGKTIITIAAAEELLAEGDINYCLILCPASLKYQWAARIKQFTKSSHVIIEGTKANRAKQYALADTGARYRYVIAGHDTVIHDHDTVAAISPDMVVIDEASAIKSFKAQRSKRVKKVFKDTPYRLALTATPIENKPDELYSIMQFVDASVLGRYDLFDKAYVNRNARGWVDSYKNLDVLNERMGDSMMRKTRHDPDVVDYLPDVDEDDWYVSMLSEHKRIYDIIAADMLVELDSNADSFHDFDPAAYAAGNDDGTPPGRLMAMHMCMEMLLDDPAVISWSADEYSKDTPNGSEYAYLLNNQYDFSTFIGSPKIDLLRDKLKDILADPTSKVVIYTKYKQMLRILNLELPWQSVMYHGDMSAKEKDAAVQEFTNNDTTRLFISSYAGGYGLDLYMAEYLINYDHPWSFGAQDQINNRHVRASSKYKKVYVRNIITLDSIEERKMRILARKREISRLAIDGKQTEDATVDVGFDYLGDHLRSVTGTKRR